jgi:hypothetical protein
MLRYFTIITLCIVFASFSGKSQPAPARNQSKTSGSPTVQQSNRPTVHLLVYFKDNTHSLYFALSEDGYTFEDLNKARPVMSGDTLAGQRGIRDPHIIRGKDGYFYLSMTDLHLFGREAGYRTTQWERGDEYGWGNNRGFVLMKSKDLIHWTRSCVNIQELFPDLEVACAWAPQSIYDPRTDRMMLYFTMRLGGRGLTKLYYAYTDDDFTRLITPPRELFAYPKPEVQILDADITPLPDGGYCMMYVAQEHPGGIRAAFSDSLTCGYVYRDGKVDFETRACEAPNVWKRNGGDVWVLMYDVFGVEPHNFGFAETSDFENFTYLGHFDDGPMRRTNFTVQKHGAVVAISSEEAERLRKHYSKPDFTDYAPAPPMGWNSWDCYGPTVEEAEVRANADYMAARLRKYGWEYVVVDIRWFVENDRAGGYNQNDPRYVVDEYGRYLPALNRFPSAAGGKGFKPLADYVHSKGLKFGVHIMRGVPKVAVERRLPVKGSRSTADQIYSTELQCEWLRDNYTIRQVEGGQEYYNSLMELYAEWGVDFIKVDDLSRPYHKGEIEMIRRAIDLCGRPIVLSMSPGKTPASEAIHASSHSNMWRMVDDVWDVWEDLTNLMRVAQDWYQYIGPTWPDCDMIPLGRIAIRGERGKDRMSRLTRDEQYSLMSFFAIMRSPLMFGGDLPSNDEFTLSLLTNEDVLRMHRESRALRQVSRSRESLTLCAQSPVEGEKYLAVFNISDNQEELKVPVSMKSIGIAGKCRVKNLWTGEVESIEEDVMRLSLRPHECRLMLISKP